MLRYNFDEDPLKAYDPYAKAKAEGALMGTILGIVLIIIFVGMTFFITPITAPIYLFSTERARKRGNINAFNEWSYRSKLASGGAVIIVLSIASFMGFNAFSIFFNSVSNALKISPSELSAWFIRIPAIIVALTAFTLLFITGMSPTAMIFLGNRATRLREVGKIGSANTMRQFNWLIGIIAIGTVALAVVGFVIVMLFQYYY